MIHLLVIWDRTTPSADVTDLFESVGCIHTTMLSSEDFFRDPTISDTIDAALLMGRTPDHAFTATARRMREHCPDCPLILSTIADHSEKEKNNAIIHESDADLWVLYNEEKNTFSKPLWHELLRLLNGKPEDDNEYLHFKAIADHANYGIVITDPYAVILYANEWFAAIYGYSSEEITGKTIDDLYPSQHREIAELKQRLFLERHVELEEFIATKKDGSTVPTQAHLHVLNDETGTPLFVSGIVIDITERKKADEEQERARYSIENATDEVYWIHPDGQIFYANSEACRALGYTREELSGLTVFDIDPDFLKGDWEAHWQNLSENTNIQTESRHRTKDGRIYPVEISANLFIYGDDSFNCAFARDITARKQAEEDIKKSEEQLRLKLDAILSPDYAVEEEEFRNIINSDAIQSLMDDFYELTHIGIGIIDVYGTILVGTGWQDICTQFHRMHPKTKQYCLASDTILTKNIRPGEVRKHKCRNNMWDVVTPIFIGEKHMANIFLGQFFYDDEEVDPGIFARQAEEYGFDTEAYLAALDRIPRWSHEKVQTAMRFYQKLARIISDLSYSNLKLATLVEHHKQTEVQLAFSEKRYQSYINIAPEGVFVTDADGHYLEVNQAACALLGYTEDELLSMDISMIVPADEVAVAHQHFRTLQQTGKLNVEINLQKKDESICTTILGATVLPNGTTIGFTSDITERKQTEEKILHLNRLLGAIRNVNQLIIQEKDRQTLIQQTCDILTGVGEYAGVWIVLVGLDGTILNSAKSNPGGFVSPLQKNFKDGILVKSARDSLLTHGKVTLSTFSSDGKPCTDEGNNDILNIITTGLASDKTVYGMISAMVPPHIANDPEEQDLFSEVAGDLGFALYNIDLKEKRKKAEDEIKEKNKILQSAYQDLEESKERLSQIIEFLPDATFAIDSTGHVIAWNKAIAEMTGISKSEILGRGDYEYGYRLYGKRRPILIDYILHPELRDVIDYPIWYKEGDTLIAETYVPHLYEEKGAHVWFTARRLYDSEGNVAGAIESIRDITEMKKNEEEIIETSHTLKKRVKELTCLRELSDIMLKNPSEEELCIAVLPLIQAAMSHPEHAEVAVRTKTRTYHTSAFQETGPDIQKPFSLDAEWSGSISVRYPGGHPKGDDNTFLPEEDALIQIICERISTYLKRRIAEAYLVESEEKYRELFNNMSSGVAVYEVANGGRDFIFRDINKAAEAIDHIRRGDVIGKSLFDMFPGIENFGLPDVLRRVSETGTPESFPLAEYRDEHLRGWRENYVYQLPSGEVVAVYDDQTEKKQALDALVESEHKYHAIFNNINEAVFLHEVMEDNSRGHFIEVNDIACDRLGYTREELLRLTVKDINTTPIQKEDPARVVALKTQAGISFDAEQVRKDGSVFPVHVNARLIEIHERIFILSLVRDLTEERAAREREMAALRQIEENLTQLGILNDEIRNPLAIITGIVGFSDESIVDPVMEQVRAIDDIVHRLDQGWLESEKIREYLRKHHGIL